MSNLVVIYEILISLQELASGHNLTCLRHFPMMARTRLTGNEPYDRLIRAVIVGNF